MSKASRRPNREGLKAQRKARNRAQKALRQRLAEEGVPQSSHRTITNRKSRYQSPAAEGQARSEATWEHLKVLRTEFLLLTLLQC